MRKTARRIRRNYRLIRETGMQLSPVKMYTFLILPVALVAVILGFTFRSEFGNRFMYQHSIKAPDEMRRLHKQFYAFIRRK